MSTPTAATGSKPIKAMLDVGQQRAAEAIQRAYSERLGVDLSEADLVRLALRKLGQSVRIDFPIAKKGSST